MNKLVMSEFIQTENNIRHINVFYNNIEKHYSVTIKEWGKRIRVPCKMFESSDEAFNYAKSM
jgi:hypothetical protein